MEISASMIARRCFASIAVFSVVFCAWVSTASAEGSYGIAPAQHSCAEFFGTVPRLNCEICVARGSNVGDCYWQQQISLLKRDLGRVGTLVGPFPLSRPVPSVNASPAPLGRLEQSVPWEPYSYPVASAMPTATASESFHLPRLSGALAPVQPAVTPVIPLAGLPFSPPSSSQRFAELLGNVPSAYTSLPPTAAPNRISLSPGAPIASPIPLTPQVRAWTFVPTPGNNLAPQPVSPYVPREAQLSIWCRTFNTAKGVAEGALLTHEVVGLLGGTESAVPAAEAEGIGTAIARAGANHTVVILFAVGASVYLLEKECSPTSK